MRERNYVEGHNLLLRRAFAAGKYDRLPALSPQGKTPKGRKFYAERHARISRHGSGSTPPTS